MEQNVETYIALTPDDLRASKECLINWVTGKIEKLKTESWELKENLEIATKNKWRSSGLKSALNRSQKRVTFYNKILAAVGRGYLIIPPFPIEAFAIRTKALFPKPRRNTYDWDQHIQEAQGVPMGEGRYISPKPSMESSVYQEEGKDVTYRWADEFNDIEFPVALAKPQILERAADVINELIFDEIGLVGQKKDPILVGSVILRQGYSEKRVNFFLGWWLNIEDI